MRAAHGMARHRRQSPEGERRAASFRRNGECRGWLSRRSRGRRAASFRRNGECRGWLSRRSRGRRAASSRSAASSRRSRAALCLRGGGGRSRCAPYFRKKYRLLLTERAVCVIMKSKIVRSGLFLAKECRQILSARRVLPPSAGSCAYLCASVAAGSAAGKPPRRL